MATTVPRRDRVLRCVISAADRGSTAARARHILLTDQVLDAAQALDAGPTAALGRIKPLLRDGESRDLDSSLDAEAIAIVASAAGAEGREGVRAFRKRRPPQFHDEPVSG